MPEDTRNRNEMNDTNDVNEEQPERLSHPSYEDLLKKLNETEEKINEYEERILRMQADADNANRRARLNLEDAHKFAIKKFVDELLPIIDSLELSINNVPTDKNEAVNCMLEGIQLTLKMFYSAMEKFGIKQINPLSEQFNPEFEQAISTQVDPKAVPGTVLSVLQKGYTLNNRLIRPALVVVAKEEN